MILVDAVSKTYRARRNEAPAVEAASLSASEGEAVGMVGRSGSGKTTLLAMLGGLLQPTAGRIVVAGVDISGLGEEDLARFRNEHIGFVPQNPGLVGSLTVIDNIRLPCHISSRKGGGNGRAEFLLGELGMLHLRDRYPNQLSGGEIRRTAIARALATQPSILLADEPTGDLDRESMDLVLGLFRSAQKSGTTIVFSTHEQKAVHYASSLYRMNLGKLSRIAPDAERDA